ncbi:MAG TPA: hypothetical protein ENI97_06810 [Gammaproteobacteria bacterium]|nr:hypothetical protein [Gammaproteobacteria bacterium]
MRIYTQLTQEERYQIYILKKEKYSQTRMQNFWGAINPPSVRGCGAIGARKAIGPNRLTSGRLSGVSARLNLVLESGSGKIRVREQLFLILENIAPTQLYSFLQIISHLL